eukprot:10750186-Lingulodinium_polyedra.AAC.1
MARSSPGQLTEQTPMNWTTCRRGRGRGQCPSRADVAAVEAVKPRDWLIGVSPDVHPPLPTPPT